MLSHTARGVRIASSLMARSQRQSSTAPPSPAATPPRPRRRALASDGPTLASSLRALRERDARRGARRASALAEATVSLPTLAEAVASRGLPRGALVLLHQTHYHDKLLQDMGMPHRRKGANVLAEVFAPYTPADYAGVVG